MKFSATSANRGLPVALPVPDETGPQAPNAKPGGPAQRPAAGPVVPLTATKVVPEELLGGGRAPARAPAVDATASKVLVKGEPIAAPSGRADDFSWPRGSGADPQPAVAEPTPPPAATPATATAPATAPAAAKANQVNPTAEQKPPAQRRPRTNNDAPRPPLFIQGLFR